MPNIEDNPYIKSPDYFSTYRENLEAFHKSSNIELDALVFHVFNTEDGKKLTQIIKEKFVNVATPPPINEHYDKTCIYYEGYRSAFRNLLNLSDFYVQRKEGEAKDAILKKTEVKK